MEGGTRTHTHPMHLLLQISHMAQLLYLKKRGSNEVVPFELYDGGRLAKDVVLTQFGLTTLRVLSDNQFVAVGFRPDGLSFRVFVSNSETDPLEVDGAQGQWSVVLT